MSSGYVVPVDPQDLNRLVGYDPRMDDADFDEEDDQLTPEELELEQLEQDMRQILHSEGGNLDHLLDRIPDREADVIELYFLHGKRQADIATIFGITQAAVSYRLGRGIKRIKFVLEIPHVTREQMKEDLSEAFPPEVGRTDDSVDDPEANLHIDVRILLRMWETTCQSEVAHTLSLTQGRVRHRFFRAVAKLQELAAVDAKLQPYSEIFGKIASKRFNILREVKLPQWSGRGGNEIR